MVRINLTAKIGTFLFIKKSWTYILNNFGILFLNLDKDYN